MRVFIILMVMLSSVSIYAESIVKYGISSMLSASDTFINYEELNNYIAKNMGVKSEIIHKENYNDMNRLLENQQVDFASICTGAMLYLSEDVYSIVAVPEVDGKSTYKSFIISNKNTEAESPVDLKGRTFAMTDRLSNTGYLFPTYYFTKFYGKPDRFFSKVFFTGTHDKSIYLVNKGVVDAAAVDNLVYFSVEAQNKSSVENINIIHISEEFGIPPVVASKKMTDESVKKLRDVLLNMHKDEEGERILKGLMMDRFIIPDPKSYENVIKMKDYVESNN